MKTTFATLLLFAAFPAIAQTTAKPPVHHAASSTTHHTASAAHCAVEAPVLSLKIPAVPTTAPKCPSVAYQLTYLDTQIGTGELAAPRKWYTVNYTGYLIDGTNFDSSVGKEPITFPYGAHRVITGWDTGFDGMRVGGKRRLFVPYQLAYGEAGRPPVIPAKAELIFDVELISQSDSPPAPKTPPAPQVGAKPATPTTEAPAAKPAAPATNPAPAAAGATTTTPSGNVTPPATKPQP